MYLYKKPKKRGDKEVIYWRKANQIFRWFEVNCCNGVTENCKEYDVTYEQLLQLRSICQRVLMDREQAKEDTIKLEEQIKKVKSQREALEYELEALEEELKILKGHNK